MADFKQKYPLDYRVGGDTIDDFAQKYIKEIPIIYQFLNNVRGLNSEGTEQVEPTKYQLKAEDDKLYIRNKENTDWVYLGEIKPCLGLTPDVNVRLLNTSDIAKSPGEAGKLLTTNDAGLLEVSITGNAAKIGEKTIQINTLSDGEILVYRSSIGAFTNESKGTIGLGKALTITYGDDKELGSYSGNSETSIDVKPPTMTGASSSASGTSGLVPAPGTGDNEKFLKGDGTWAFAALNLLQRSKAYAVGDIAYSINLPSWARLECVTAGTTGAEEPDFSTPPMDNSRIGTYITDGTAIFIIDDIRDGTAVGSVRGSLYLPAGYIKANGATVERADYPRLVKFITDNNLWTDNVAENLGLFGKGDGSTTMVLPDYRDRVVTYKDMAGQTIDAGLPNITGYVPTGSFTTTGASGAFYQTYRDNWAGTNSGGQRGDVNFDASRSNDIYGASDTVQSPAIALIPIIRY